MITNNNFFSSTLNTVDAVIGNFVNTAYVHFVQANVDVITLLFTLYVMVMGYRFLTHQQKTDLASLMKHIVVMSCVYGMVMSWHLYNLLVYNIFTNEPGHIAQVLIDSAGHAQPGESIAKALDGIYEAVINATMGFFGQVSFTSLAFAIYGVLVFVIGTALCVLALLLFIYAKMMMAVSLALGPIFILFILWEQTKNMFTAWLNKLITLALIPIVTSSILALMLSVINVTLPNMNQPIDDLRFYGIAPFLGLTLTTTLILSQVFRICSALGGGITLVSLSKGVEIARASVNQSGVKQASQKAATWSRNKINKTKQRLFRN